MRATCCSSCRTSGIGGCRRRPLPTLAATSCNATTDGVTSRNDYDRRPSRTSCHRKQSSEPRQNAIAPSSASTTRSSTTADAFCRYPQHRSVLRVPTERDGLGAGGEGGRGERREVEG